MENYMKEAERMRCVGYARSAVTGEYAQDPTEAQAEEIRQECRPFRLLEVLQEPGRSGNDLDRPQLKKLLRMVRRGRVDAVVVAKLAALSRSPRQFDDLMRQFKRHGVRLISVKDGINTAIPAGKAKIDAIRTLARTLRTLDGHRRAREYGASIQARCA